jgi:hypothetical protein
MADDTRKSSHHVESGGYGSWVICFTTEGVYNVAVEVLRRMPEVHFNPPHGTVVVINAGLLAPSMIIAPVIPLQNKRLCQ